MASRRVLLIALSAFALVAAVLWIPWATKSRVVTAATPVPAALVGYVPAPLPGGATGCMSSVTFSPQTQIGEIAVVTKGKPGPALAISAKATGYRASARVPAGYHDNDAIRFDLATPKDAVIGSLCIRNTGKQTVVLKATTEFRTMGRPQLSIDGTPQPMDPKLIFYERDRSSFLSRAGDILRHAAVFTPPFLPRIVLGLLALIALIGIPVAVAFALKSAVEADSETG
jgi:hypothetical protein